MKALVIGGGGFVGPYLVRHLTDDCGYEVTVTKTEKEQLVMDNAVVKNLDILDIGQIVELLRLNSLIIYFILLHSHQLHIRGRIQRLQLMLI